MPRGSLFVAMIGLAAGLSAGPVIAQEPHHDWGHEHFDHHGPALYGRAFHDFSPVELGVWRGGRWSHDWHDGRFGWWWVVDGWWYFYPQPVYPYPTYVPPAVIAEQPPPVPIGLSPASVWYYCDDPQGYYPYVASCRTAWRAVPITPPPAPSEPPPGPTAVPPPPPGPGQ